MITDFYTVYMMIVTGFLFIVWSNKSWFNILLKAMLLVAAAWSTVKFVGENQLI